VSTGIEVLTAVVLNVDILWNIAPRSPYVNRRFGEDIANDLLCLATLCTLVSCSSDFYPEDKAIRSSETSIHIWTMSKLNQTRWSESASELYRPSDHRLSVKLVPTFADTEYRVVSVTVPYGRILDF
jgi:hypothetical protein